MTSNPLNAEQEKQLRAMDEANAIAHAAHVKSGNALRLPEDDRALALALAYFHQWF